MKNRLKIMLGAVLLLTSCQELPAYLAGDTALARAGKKVLRLHDVESAVPQGVAGDDSVALVEAYVDRWVRKQLKLQEAQVVFSSAEADIARMVEEYRQALLIRKLEQHYVDTGVDTTFTVDDIATYYNAHKADFRLERPVVKGRIVRFGEDFRQARRLKELMASESAADRRDFDDLCFKNGFAVADFSDRWVDFTEFLSYLPTVRSKNYASLLSSGAVQEMGADRSRYYLKIDAVRREGETVPLERLETIIRRILFNQRRGEVIRRHEEELYTRAVESGEAKIYGRDKSAEEDTNNE